jgi:HSP20 family molecular chaperone IbpA
MSDSIPIEVHHGSRSVSVLARLPGVRLQDVRIGLTPDELTIDAQAPEGPRHYEFSFPSPVDDRRATMRFREGVLWMHLPKRSL